MRSPVRQRSGICGHVADEPDAADDRRGRDRLPARLVVERHVPGDDRDAELDSAAREMPSIACASSQPISGFSGLPKFRQSVSASGSPPAHATFIAASMHSLPAGLQRVAATERRAIKRDGEPARSVDTQHRGIEPRSTHGPRADEVVVLLEDPGLGLVVHGCDRRRLDDLARCLRDLVARALVGQQRGRDRADDLVVEETRAARRGP